VILFALTAWAPTGEDVKLPSGREIRILGVAKVYFSNGEAALMLRYQTAIPLDDVGTLQSEASEVWERFRIDIEKSGYTIGIVSANERHENLAVTPSRTFNFVYKKSTSGEWSALRRQKH
jgi:hypothetical protein